MKKLMFLIVLLSSCCNEESSFKVGDCVMKNETPGRIVHLDEYGAVIEFKDGTTGFRSKRILEVRYFKISCYLMSTNFSAGIE